MVSTGQLFVLASWSCSAEHADKIKFLEYLTKVIFANRPAEMAAFLTLCNLDEMEYTDKVDLLSSDEKRVLLAGVKHYCLFEFLGHSPIIKMNSKKIAEKISSYLSLFSIGNQVRENEILLYPASKKKWMDLPIK